MIWARVAIAAAVDMIHKSQNAPVPYPTMIPASIQNRNIHISVLNGALWDSGKGRPGMC